MEKLGDLQRRAPDGLSDPRFRTVPEALVRETLLLGGFAFDLAAGRRAHAAMEVETALDGWVAAGLGFARDAAGGRLFDLAEVLNRMKWSALTGRDRFWPGRCVTTGRRLVTTAEEAWPADGFQPFDFFLARRFNLARLTGSTAALLRVPLPVAGPDLKDVKVEWSAPPGAHVDIDLAGGRLSARVAQPKDQLVELAVSARFSAAPMLPQPRPEPLSEAESTAYLKSEEGLIRVTPRVRALADALAPPQAGPEAFAHAAWEFLCGALCLGSIHYDQVDARAPGDWVLDHGWCDCLLGSALFAGLCRAREIPARLVSGGFLYVLAPTNHSWAEYWTEEAGWTPLDLQGWDLSEGGRDLDWRDRFFGRLDRRLVTERLPFQFTGPMTLRLPRSWHMVQTAIEGGARVAFFDLDGDLVREDLIRIG